MKVVLGNELSCKHRFVASFLGLDLTINPGGKDNIPQIAAPLFEHSSLFDIWALTCCNKIDSFSS